jgi:hypothetical protein
VRETELRGITGPSSLTRPPRRRWRFPCAAAVSSR